MAKVVLAYSGGLATTVALHLLKMRMGYQVITFSGNLGQHGNQPAPTGEKAIEHGAVAAHIGDLRERFLRDFAFSALRAGAVHENGYLLSAALARPLIVAEVVKIAREEDADAIAYGGGSGKSNDQIRFEVSAAQLVPTMKVLAPLREFELNHPEEIRSYAKEHDIPTQHDDQLRLSILQNLWGAAIELDQTADPWDPVEGAYRITAPYEEATDEPVEVAIGFAKGVPVSLDGVPAEPIELVERLNDMAGRRGIGRIVTMEDRLVGIKVREVYEQPAATLLYQAKRSLDRLVLSRDTLLLQDMLSRKYAELVYDGCWYSELREALDAFFERVNEYATGEVRLLLRRGSSFVLGSRSPHTLFSKSLATMRAEGDSFAHDAARGFMDIYSFRLRAHGDRWRSAIE